MKNILITGGTGLVGKYLSNKLFTKGHQVALLSRKNIFNTEFKVFKWDIQNMTIDKEAIAWADIIIHLAGANIGEKRWTNKRKQEILESRTKSTNLIYKELKKRNKKLDAFISASAIGIYEDSAGSIHENSPQSNSFLGKVCQRWEEEIDQIDTLDIRTVKLRTGVVLSNKGGALKKMTRPVKLGLGAVLGNGKQIIPWIHIDDLCELYINATENKQWSGAYNAVASNESNKSFTKTIAYVLHKPFWFPNIPSFLLKILLGEMAMIVLQGSNISNEKILKSGFSFKFTDLKLALSDLLNQ